jgi:hypothetical protein
MTNTLLDRSWCAGMPDPSDMTMFHGVVGVDGRWWQPCPSATVLPWLVHSPTLGYGVGVLNDVTRFAIHQCGTFSLISGTLALSHNHVPCLTLACTNRCYWDFVCMPMLLLTFGLFVILYSWDCLECVCVTLPLFISLSWLSPIWNIVYSLTILSWLCT